MADRLLDTNALSAAMKADPALTLYLRGLGRCRLATSVVAEGEIRFGLLRLFNVSGANRSWLFLLP